MLPPSSNVPAFLFMCHTLRFSAISSVLLYSFMPSLMLCSHSFLGFPFFPFPVPAWLASSWWYPPLPSFLNMCSYHRFHVYLRNVVIVSMPASLQMSSLCMWSFRRRSYSLTLLQSSNHWIYLSEIEYLLVTTT